MKEKRSIKSYVITVLITMLLSITGTTLILYSNFNFTPKDNNDVISNTIVTEKLGQIDQWATSELRYQGTISKTTPRKVFGQRVLLGDNKIEIEYEGVIKVGYVAGDIRPEVNKTAKTITVTLSSPKVFDNYIILDHLKIKEENNMLNPLRVSDLPTYFGSVETDELSRAEKELDIYAEAEKKAKEVITDKLSVFSDYQVVFAESSKHTAF